MQPLARADWPEGPGRSMDLPLRYLRWAPDRAAPFTEAAFGHREKWVALEPRAVALVLVDVWNIGWGPAPLVADIPLTEELCVEAGATFGRRVQQLTQESIVPAVQAARSRADGRPHQSAGRPPPPSGMGAGADGCTAVGQRTATGATPRGTGLAAPTVGEELA